MTAFAASFDHGAPAPGTPSRGTRALSAVTILILAVPLSGVPRYWAGVSIDAGLAISLAMLGAFVALTWPLLGVKLMGWRPTLAFAVLTISYSLIALSLLAAPQFDGFPAGTCADAGNHIFLKNRFIDSDPKVYEGMISLYALDHWLLRLGWNDLGGLRLAYRLVVVICVTLMSAIMVVGTSSPAIRRPSAGLSAAMLLATSISGFFVALPLLHYYQVDGYLAQVFSLVPLCLALGSYAFASTRFARVLALLVSVGFYRFTYLLNAGDLMLACAAAVFVEWRAAPKVRLVRLSLGALVVICAAGSIAAYVGFRRISEIPGGFRAAPMSPQLVGLGLLSLVFGAVGKVCRHFGTPLKPSQQRVASFLAILCGAPTLIVSGWLLSGHPPIYYYEKYAFCSIVLASLCVLPIVLPAAVGLVKDGGKPTAGVAASALLAASCAGLFGLAWSADTYAPGLRERFAGPPFNNLEPHADPAVWSIIASTLRKQHAEFGGFLTPRWPESQFTNAHFAVEPPRPKGAAPSDDRVWTTAKYNGIYEGETIESAGHCVFWYENRRLPAPLQQRWHQTSKAAVDRLQAQRPRSCQTFAPRDAPSRRFAVCNRCFSKRGENRDLSLGGDLNGFHGIERDTDGSVVRWTKGNGKVPFILTEAEAELACRILVQTVSSLPYELWVDGTRLGTGPRQPLPRFKAGDAHLLEIRSPTFTPSSTGASADGRILGVRVSKLVLECSDDGTPASSDDVEPGAISVISATYGRKCGASPGNYTQSLIDECDGRIDCSYPPADRRGDPFPGCAKDFSVEYRCGLQRTVRRADHASDNEHYAVALSCD